MQSIYIVWKVRRISNFAKCNLYIYLRLRVISTFACILLFLLQFIFYVHGYKFEGEAKTLTFYPHEE